MRRRRVVLEARARLPLELPLARTRAPARRDRRRRAPGITAFGKPAVCSMTCSTVTAALPSRRELGHVRRRPGACTSSRPVADQQPHRRRHDRLRAREDAVAGVVASPRRTSRTRRARRRAPLRAGTTAASRSRRRRASAIWSRVLMRLRPPALERPATQPTLAGPAELRLTAHGAGRQPCACP